MDYNFSKEQLQEVTPFAFTNYRNSKKVFGIKLDDRRRHMYVIGKTGMGKSTLLENMITTDIAAGRGVAVVDPHGDLVEKVLDFVPSDRINDVIYFDPSDLENPIGFNVLEKVDSEYTHLVASGLIGVFKKIWADSWGPRLEYILANAIHALLSSDGNTMLGITRMLVDKAYRKKVVSKITDPMVRSFWVDEFENYNDRFRGEAIAPIQNKVGQFLSSAIIRNIVGQTKSTISLSDIMNNKKILLMNLSKGKVGEENSALLGAMMITRIQLSAMERVRIPEDEREDFILYVDEFQNFATEAFATILSEARKYRLSLVMGHQYIKQVPEPVQDAVFGNVGTMICFRVGAEDAERFEQEFSETFTANDFVNLQRGHIYLKLMIDGIASKPFSAVGIPPLSEDRRHGHMEKILKVSKERYARPREIIEDKISRWAVGAAAMNKELEMEEKKKGKTVYVSKCDTCGERVETFFDPDPNKPLYCESCFAKIKEEREAKKDGNTKGPRKTAPGREPEKGHRSSERPHERKDRRDTREDRSRDRRGRDDRRGGRGDQRNDRRLTQGGGQNSRDSRDGSRNSTGPKLEGKSLKEAFTQANKNKE